MRIVDRMENGGGWKKSTNERFLSLIICSILSTINCGNLYENSQTHTHTHQKRGEVYAKLLNLFNKMIPLYRATNSRKIAEIDPFMCVTYHHLYVKTIILLNFTIGLLPLNKRNIHKFRFCV